MLLNEIFAKDVQRPIEGVIKADDAAHLGTEVDEYVLTNEAAKGLELLLEAFFIECLYVERHLARCFAHFRARRRTRAGYFMRCLHRRRAC